MKQKFGILAAGSMFVVWVGMWFYTVPIVKGVWDSPVIEFFVNIALSYTIGWAIWTALDNSAGN